MMELFQIGVDILNTSVSTKTKKILAHTGSNTGDGQTDSGEVEWWQHVGFASRPAKPVKGRQAAQAITIRNGTIDCAIASQDLRGLELYGQLDYGEFCVYAAGEDGNAQGRILGKKDGSVALYTLQGNTAGGASVTVQVLPSGVINIAGPFGGIQIADGTLKILSGAGAGVQLDATGVSLLGQTIIANGSVVLGDASATGVATQLSFAPLIAALVALCGALQPFCAFPTISALSGGTSQAVQTAAAALAAIAVLPTTFSLKVKAS
jgi:hypothetical protein